MSGSGTTHPSEPKPIKESNILILVSLGFIAVIFLIFAFTQYTEIQTLKIQLNQTNAILSETVNKTNNQLAFDQQVVNWANIINKEITLLNQTKK